MNQNLDIKIDLKYMKMDEPVFLFICPSSEPVALNDQQEPHCFYKHNFKFCLFVGLLL